MPIVTAECAMSRQKPFHGQLVSGIASDTVAQQPRKPYSTMVRVVPLGLARGAVRTNTVEPCCSTRLRNFNYRIRGLKTKERDKNQDSPAHTGTKGPGETNKETCLPKIGHGAMEVVLDLVETVRQNTVEPLAEVAAPYLALLDEKLQLYAPYANRITYDEWLAIVLSFLPALCVLYTILAWTIKRCCCCCNKPARRMLTTPAKKGTAAAARPTPGPGSRKNMV
jgi:hypothetical protein